ncbi:hypothetical protein [Thaumasiovibrio subtropicus]|uniref:hypothetical protein n=1 Tax=Thaumasiovibrio subtropicus TaxID=1891207 RepID=UPI000B34B88A|nr:hypothetical protein [Thaumasiovibrio subtropicus]
MRILFLLLLFFSIPSVAEEPIRDYRDHPNFNSIALFAGTSDYKDSLNVSDPSFVAVEGYSHLIERYYMTVNGRHSYFDDTTTQLTRNYLNIGVGTYYALGLSTDLVAEASAVVVDANVGDREVGASAKIGVWAAFGPELDLKATLGGVSVDDDTYSQADVTLFRHFNRTFSAGFMVNVTKDWQFYGLGMRYDVLF